MNPVAKPRGIRGLRTAAITYVLVLLLGLGAAGAHALWNISGSVSSTVTAGTWGPQTVAASSITCSPFKTSVDFGNNGINIGFDPATDAAGYKVLFRDASGKQLGSKTVTSPSVSFPITTKWFNDDEVFAIKIVPFGAGADPVEAEATYRSATMTKTNLRVSIACTAYTGTAF